MIFKFSIGGYFNDRNYEFIYKEGNLIVSQYTHYPEPEADKKVAVTGDPDWENLIGFLKQCNWLKNYNAHVCDGTQWDLKARAKGLKLTCYGSNDYPEDFETFIRLLNQVIASSGIQVKDGPYPTYIPE